jgi:hypothetical protein
MFAPFIFSCLSQQITIQSNCTQIIQCHNDSIISMQRLEHMISIFQHSSLFISRNLVDDNISFLLWHVYLSINDWFTYIKNASMDYYFYHGRSSNM